MLRRMVDAEQTDAVLDQLRAKEVYEIFQDWQLIATIVDPRTIRALLLSLGVRAEVADRAPPVLPPLAGGTVVFGAPA